MLPMPTRILLCLAACLGIGHADPKLDFARAVVARERGDRAAAVDLLKAAQAADPDAFPLTRELASASDRPTALGLYQQYSAAHPGRLDAQLIYADLLRGGAHDAAADAAAADLLESALKRFPGHPGIIRRLFRASEAKGDRARSLELFQQLIAKPPLSFEAMSLAEDWSRVLFEADDAAARQRLDELYESACATEPQQAGLAKRAAEYFRKTKRLPQAIAILKRHIAAVPTSLDLRGRLALLQFANQQADDAVANLLAMLEIDPQRATAHQALAKHYREIGQLAKAREHAAAMLRFHGGSADAFLELAGEYLTAQQAREARLLLERAVFAHPQNAELAKKLAIASFRDPESRGRSAPLFRAAQELIAKDAAPDPAFLQATAEAAVAENRPQDAEKQLRDAIRAFPPEAKKETAAALRQLAGLWEKENRNLDAARALRQRAAGLDPAP